MLHRLATPEDSNTLAELNHQLILDESHRNAMTVPELAERMRGWLATGYQVSIFEDDSGILAYALYRANPDHIYLRQFFVQRHKRRAGIGLQCMQMLLSAIWPKDKRIVVEALCRNPAGIAFWRKVGFTDYSLALEINPS